MKRFLFTAPGRISGSLNGRPHSCTCRRSPNGPGSSREWADRRPLGSRPLLRASPGGHGRTVKAVWWSSRRKRVFRALTP